MSIVSPPPLAHQRRNSLGEPASLAPAPIAPPTDAPARISPRRDLQASLGDAISYSVMVGIGETYFAAFALALNTGETFAGLLSTLPMLAGGILQLFTPWLVRRAQSLRLYAYVCVALQAASLLLLPLAACFTGSAAGLAIFAAITMYWAFGLASAPVWNTWIEEIVPHTVRTNFFARRARISQFTTLIGFVVGAIALQLGKAGGWLRPAFVGIFLTAAVCRFLSAGFLRSQSDPSAGRVPVNYISIRKLLRGQAGELGGKLVLYLLAVQTAVQISGPYFAPFMLAKEKMSYLTFMLLIGIAFMGKVVSLPLWGRVAHTAGPKRLLWIAGMAIVPVAGLWVFGDLFPVAETSLRLNLGFADLSLPLSAKIGYYCVVQILSGFAWGGFELAVSLMLLQAIPRSQRTSMMTLYNCGNAAALVVGSLCGAAILQSMHESHAAYLTLFGLSSSMRLVTLLFLARASSAGAGKTPPKS